MIKFTHQTHDTFVRTAMSDLRVAREFFTMHLPPDIYKVTNLDHLILQPRSQINDIRKESIVDILYKTTIAEKEAYLYLLIEHQSTPDQLMAFRMLKYTCNVIDQHLKQTKQKVLPLVYPMVIYHAERPYLYSTDIRDLVDAPRTLVERYFLKPFQLIDLARIEDSQLKQYQWAGVMEFALKHIFARDVLGHIRNIVEILSHLDQLNGRDYVSTVLQYFLERGEVKNKEEFYRLINEQISPEMGETVMTLGEQLFREGVEKGRKEGREEGKEENTLEIAKRLLKQGLDVILIANATGLSLAQIENL